MGIVPLEYEKGQSADSLGLTGNNNNNNIFQHLNIFFYNFVEAKKGLRPL